jgi:Flp pilus assembly pilin Flp
MFAKLVGGLILAAALVHRKVIKGEEGASIVEYCLLVGLMGFACVLAMTALGFSLSEVFGRVDTTINGATR